MAKNNENMNTSTTAVKGESMDATMGTISQVIGPVVDVKFEGEPPAVYTALEIDNNGFKLVLEVQQQLSGGIVRAIAMSTTDGIKRGQAVNKLLYQLAKQPLDVCLT